MHNKSYQNGLIPAEQPFANNTYKYYGNEKINIENEYLEIVDWVLISLRSDKGSILEKKAALLLTDGKLIDPFTNSENITFFSNANNKFYVSVVHKTHLAVILANLHEKNTMVDFSQSGVTKGIAQTTNVNNIEILIPGDLDSNGIINNLDYNKWAINNAAVNIYGSEDIDGNGIVNNLDYNFWARNRDKVGTIELLENGY